MTTDHRAEAVERLRASDYQRQEGDFKGARLETAAALVHATLARGEEHAASTADLRDANTLLRRRDHNVRNLIAAHIVEGITSNVTSRSRAAMRLARDLNEADANVDDLLNEQLPTAEWPAHLAQEGDPWANPLVKKIDTFSRVVAGHLADALLNRAQAGAEEWARRLTYALEAEGIDLTDVIKARISDATLGRNPSEPPF